MDPRWRARWRRAVPLLLAAFLLAALLPGKRAAGAADWQPHPELLVTAAWLGEHAGDAHLRIVDVRAAEDYAAGHIPGAVNLPAEHLFATVNGVEGMLPALPALTKRLGAAGIGPGTAVVAYDASGGLYAARLFWVLDYLGQGGGHLLDGGWQAWRRAGGAVSATAATAEPERLAARLRPDAIAELDWVRAHLDDPHVVLVDARSSLEYEGVTRYARFGGHIPGAVSMEWKRSLRADGTFLPPGQLREMYAALGVTPDREAVVYCQVLVRAAHSYFTLRWLGLPRVRGYDGSWAEWGNRADTPKAGL
jgi:thiosulfate/3-mercaptopyruvate sulfurtransferase